VLTLFARNFSFIRNIERTWQAGTVRVAFLFGRQYRGQCEAYFPCFTLPFTDNDDINLVGKFRTRKGQAEAIQEAQYLYENPPVAESEELRLENGMNYHYTRGWDIKKASEKADVPYGALYR